MLTAMGDVLRECYARGWITTRDGNVSLRRSVDGMMSKTMYITPVGVRKNIIHPEHLVKIELPLEGKKTPKGASTEFWMHYYLQHDATTTRCVLHVHPTHVVAAMHAGFDLQTLSRHFPEISRYTQVGKSVPFFEAGTKALAEMTSCELRGSYVNNTEPIIYDIVGQANHGACAVGKHPWDAFEHVERLNHICEIVLASGVRPNE